MENFIFCSVCFSELFLLLFTTSMGRYQKINKIFYICCLCLFTHDYFGSKIFVKYYSKMVIFLYLPCPPLLLSIKAVWWVEAAIKRCSCKNVFWKFAADLQENTHAEVRFQQRGKATLLRSQFGMGVVPKICYIFSEHLFLRTTLDGCFWRVYLKRYTRKGVLGTAVVILQRSLWLKYIHDVITMLGFGAKKI